MLPPHREVVWARHPVLPMAAGSMRTGPEVQMVQMVQMVPEALFQLGPPEPWAKEMAEPERPELSGWSHLPKPERKQSARFLHHLESELLFRPDHQVDL